MKKTNTTLFQDPNMENQPITLDIRLHRGLLITYHLHYLKLFDFQSMVLLQTLNINVGQAPISMININNQKDELTIIRKLYNEIEMNTITISVKDKRLVEPIVFVKD